MVVQHNLRAMNSNRMLGITAKQQAKSSEKLSSGYKISRAADDAAGLAISEKMRKQIRGLTQASLNAQDGISAVQTAEGALTEVHDMLQRMNELAVKAANGTNSESDRRAIQDEVNQLVTEIDRVAETTKFNETYLLKGDKKATSTVYEYASTQSTISKVDGTAVTLFDICGSTLTAEAAKEALAKGESLYTDKPTSTAAVAGDAITAGKAQTDLYDKSGHVVFKKGEAVVGGTFAGLFTDAKGTAAAAADVAVVTVAGKDLFNADGTLAFAKGAELSAADVTGITNYRSAFTEGTKAVEGTDYKITEPNLFDKDGNKIAANGLESFFEKDDAGKMVYKGGLFDSNGDEVGTVGSALKDDADLKKFIATRNDGTNALDLSLHVGADSTSNNQIEMKISAMDAGTLGVRDIKVSGADDKNALDAIDTIKASIQRVSDQRSALGAIQNRLEHTVNNLDNVVENTTAAESQIRDTDMATEMVKYSNNNILARAGQAMLAQSNQANQGVLSLLQ